jgi:hypothetical protein
VFRNLNLEKTHGSYVLKSDHSDQASRYVLEGDELMIRGVVPHKLHDPTISSSSNKYSFECKLGTK